MGECTKKEFLQLRRNIIREEFNGMNDEQMEAVVCVRGPLLVLAGAGSGKTTTLVNRIANMIKYGDAYYSNFVPDFVNQEYLDNLSSEFKNKKLDEESKKLFAVDKVDPRQILAITFTNKAANEVKERLLRTLGESANLLTSSTFHSLCASFLREFADRLGFTRQFNIYDTDDSSRLMKSCQKSLGIDNNFLSYRMILERISRAKDKMINFEKFFELTEDDERDAQIAKAYELYQKELKRLQAMDFNDLIFNAVILLERNSDVAAKLQDSYKYILVDEYQDTNEAQQRLLDLLVSKQRDICVVGDDDQSIYSFRGATLRNIMGFEKNYSNCKVVHLQQNYRSTKNILEAANSVIKNNASRKGKVLWTNNRRGEKIKIHTAFDESYEAKYIANRILEAVSSGKSFKDMAVLYRMNSQSSVLEQAFVRASIPYKIIGGLRFYDRKEIKDIISYLSVVNNPNDEMRLRRIINNPKRLIGEKTISKIAKIALETGRSFLDIARNSEKLPDLCRSALRLTSFARLVDSISNWYKENTTSLYELYEMILRETNFIEAILFEKDNSALRVENIKELGANIKRYEKEYKEKATLSRFLEEISLVMDADSYDENSDSVSMMTIHAAKGLEFPTVFIPGMEEGIFPRIQTICLGSNDREIEEERRLAYVGITRAKERLYLINTDARMIFGNISHNKISRFVKEIPDDISEISIVKTWSEIEKKTKLSEFRKKEKMSLSLSAKSFNRSPTIDDGSLLEDFKKGDLVTHKTFGKGSVLSSKSVGNDRLLEVNFEEFGKKKLMSKFSPLVKLT
ncbi:MAG: UvrD-helicase domain-containing protein [Oscillospiraceae bacterium]|jgi:DNA helicase-2/ATP-dependent DNA helicase PcrA|nr:UvrD-helicase domain-containing protein [Oscillospiraceae bacterium]